MGHYDEQYEGYARAQKRKADRAFATRYTTDEEAQDWTEDFRLEVAKGRQAVEQLAEIKDALKTLQKYV